MLTHGTRSRARFTRRLRRCHGRLRMRACVWGQLCILDGGPVSMWDPSAFAHTSDSPQGAEHASDTEDGAMRPLDGLITRAGRETPRAGGQHRTCPGDRRHDGFMLRGNNAPATAAVCETLAHIDASDSVAARPGPLSAARSTSGPRGVRHRDGDFRPCAPDGRRDRIAAWPTQSALPFTSRAETPAPGAVAQRTDGPRHSASTAGERLAAARCSPDAVTLAELLAKRGPCVREFKVDATRHLEHRQDWRPIRCVYRRVPRRGRGLDRGTFTARARERLICLRAWDGLGDAVAAMIGVGIIGDPSR